MGPIMVPHLIALVEDDPHILNLLDDLFSEEGYRTLTISKGVAAYATIAREQPDVIILDLWLEQQGAGWAIYDQLRANDATTDIPVIICSADVGTVRARALDIAAYGDAAIEKPFDIAALLATIANLLHRATAVPA